VQVPSLATAGLEAAFELRFLSSLPLELVPLPELTTACVQVNVVLALLHVNMYSHFAQCNTVH
jgi:hypothetical protein